jgi:hypothetical protein
VHPELIRTVPRLTCGDHAPSRARRSGVNDYATPVRVFPRTVRVTSGFAGN